MTAELVGSVSVGQCVPTTATLVASATTDLTSKITGLLNVQAALTIQPPSLTAQLDGILNAAASLQAAITAGVTVAPPGVALNVTAVASALAELQASLAALASLSIALGTAGVYCITHEGESQTHGSEVQAIVNGIAPPGNSVYSVTFLATAPEVYAAMGAALLTG